MDSLLVFCRKLTKKESEMSYIEHCVQSSENRFEIKQIIMSKLFTYIPGLLELQSCQQSR